MDRICLENRYVCRLQVFSNGAEKPILYCDDWLSLHYPFTSSVDIFAQQSANTVLCTGTVLANCVLIGFLCLFPHLKVKGSVIAMLKEKSNHHHQRVADV